MIYFLKSRGALQDEARWNKLHINTRYYNTALHRGAFALPNYVLDILKEEESK